MINFQRPNTSGPYLGLTRPIFGITVALLIKIAYRAPDRSQPEGGRVPDFLPLTGDLQWIRDNMGAYSGVAKDRFRPKD